MALLRLGIVVDTPVGAAGAARAGNELNAVRRNGRRVRQRRANEANMVQDLSAMATHDNVIIGSESHDVSIYFGGFGMQDEKTPIRFITGAYAEIPLQQSDHFASSCG
jgi:hypothetical protein